MDFTHSERSLALQRRVEDFMQQHVVPVENAYYDEVRESGLPYRTIKEIMGRALWAPEIFNCPRRLTPAT